MKKTLLFATALTLLAGTTYAEDTAKYYKYTIIETEDGEVIYDEYTPIKKK